MSKTGVVYFITFFCYLLQRQAIVAGLYEPTDEDCDLRDKMPRDQKLNYDLEDIDLDKTLANMALDSDDEE